MRQQHVGKQSRAQMRHIEHLFVVEGWCASFIGESANRRRRGCQPQPIRYLALRVQLNAVVGLAALGDKALIALVVYCLWIEERRAHMKERGREKNALAWLELGAYLGLPREKRRQVVSSSPKGSLRSQRKHHAVVTVEGKIICGVISDCVLRKPYGFIREIQRPRLICAGIIVIAHRINPSASKQLNVAGNVNAILYDCR